MWLVWLWTLNAALPAKDCSLPTVLCAKWNALKCEPLLKFKTLCNHLKEEKKYFVVLN